MLIPCGNSIFCDFLSLIFRGHILVAIFVGMFATFLRGLLLQVFIVFRCHAFLLAMFVAMFVAIFVAICACHKANISL